MEHAGQETEFEAIIIEAKTTHTGQQIDGIRVVFELPESEVELLQEIVGLRNTPLIVKVRATRG